MFQSKTKFYIASLHWDPFFVSVHKNTAHSVFFETAKKEERKKAPRIESGQKS